MKTSILALAFSISALTTFAQQAIAAFADGDNTYLLFEGNGYNSRKKYVLISLWKEKTKTADIHNTQFKGLKEKLSGKKNVEVLNVEWQTQDDIQKALERFKIKVEVTNEKNIRLHTDQFNLNTSAANAFFLMEVDKATILCSGDNCEETINRFFADTN